MILGVMSDTHGNRVLMHAVAERMTKVHGAETIIHLGDDFTDGEELRYGARRVLQVPGLWCPQYRARNIERTVTLTFDGVSVTAVHTIEDAPKAAWLGGIILAGHTHQAAIVRDGRVLCINPGHLKAPENRGERASYAIITIENDTVHVAIYERNGQIRTELSVLKTEIARPRSR